MIRESTARARAMALEGALEGPVKEALNAGREARRQRHSGAHR